MIAMIKMRQQVIRQCVFNENKAVTGKTWNHRQEAFNVFNVQHSKTHWEIYILFYKVLDWFGVGEYHKLAFKKYPEICWTYKISQDMKKGINTQWSG